MVTEPVADIDVTVDLTKAAMGEASDLIDFNQRRLKFGVEIVRYMIDKAEQPGHLHQKGLLRLLLLYTLVTFMFAMLTFSFLRSTLALITRLDICIPVK